MRRTGGNWMSPQRFAWRRTSAIKDRYELRAGSGGGGHRRGGDGVIRELEALEPCRFSIVSERRA